MSESIIQQRTPEWYEARKGIVTASSIGAIMGVAPYMTRDDVMRRMVREAHGLESEFSGNVATIWGTFNEENAIGEYEMMTGNKVAPAGFYTREISGVLLGASPDGFLDGGGLIEAKCPYSMRNADADAKFKSADDQYHYYLQIQMQMMVLDLGWCAFVQWSPNMPLSIEVVNSCPAEQGNIIVAAREFYHDLDRELKNPDKHLEPKRREINSHGAKLLIDEYEDLRLSVELAQARQKDIIDDLVGMANGKDAEIHGHKLTQVTRAGAVSYAKVVKENLPDLDLEPWRGKESVYWRLT